MPIRYFFKQLLLPPGGLLLLLFFAFWWRTSRPRLARLCGVCGFFGLWLMSMPLSVEWMGRWLESEPALLAEDLPGLAQRADAIVILGAGRQTNDPAWGDDAPSLLAAERLRYAARLAKTLGAAGTDQRRVALRTPAQRGGADGQCPAAGLRRADALAGRSQPYHLGKRHPERPAVARGRRAPGGAGDPGLAHAAGTLELRAPGVRGDPGAGRLLGGANLRPFGGWLPEAQAFWQSGMLLNEAIGLVGYRLFYR